MNKQRLIPGTDLAISPLSLGTSTFGDLFGDVHDNASKIICAALDLGINYFDTAPFYGSGLAEERLGNALQGLPRSDYILSTKVGRYGLKDFDFSAARVVRSIDESLYLLNTDYLDIVFCHDVEFADASQIRQETLPALRQVQKEGKIRYVGISGLPLKTLHAISEQGVVDFVLSYGQWTLLNQELGKWLTTFRAQNIGLINAAPLAMGLLTRRGPPEWHPATQEIKNLCQDVGRQLQCSSIDLARVALQFSLSAKGPDLTLASARSVAQIEQWARWLADPLPQESLTEATKLLEPILGTLW